MSKVTFTKRKIILCSLWLAVFAGFVVRDAYQNLDRSRSLTEDRWKDVEMQSNERADLAISLLLRLKSLKTAQASDLENAIKIRNWVFEHSSSRSEKMLADQELFSAFTTVKWDNADNDTDMAEGDVELHQTKVKLQAGNMKLKTATDSYNDTARRYNDRLERFPEKVAAALFHFGAAF